MLFQVVSKGQVAPVKEQALGISGGGAFQEGETPSAEALEQVGLMF